MFFLFYFFKGYYRIAINGKGKERFLNLCSNKKILIWHLRRRQDTYLFCVSKKAFSKLKEIKEKTNITWEIKGEYGLPFFLYRYRKRKWFFLGLIFCLFFIYFLTLFIWDIQIIGTESYTEEEITKYLAEHAITTGIWKKKISCSALEEQIREDFSDTAWVSCGIEGTCLTVHLKETIDLLDIKKEGEENPCDIIATKEGTIVSIITRSGTPLVKKGEQVKEGDTLISGIIYLYNEYDELLETSEVVADGDIMAQTSYHYQEEFPLSGYEKEYTGKETKHYCLYVGQYGISFPAGKLDFSYYDVVKEKETLKVGPSFYLPLGLETTKYLEYESKAFSLTEKEAKEKAQKKLEDFISKLQQEGKEIAKNNVAITIDEGICTIKGDLSLIEPIGKIRNIS